MKQIINTGHDMLLSSSAAEGYIYVAYDAHEEDVNVELAILATLNEDDFFWTTVIAGWCSESEDLDEIVSRSLTGAIDAALDLGYEVLSFDDYEEFGKWMYDTFGGLQREEENRPRGKKYTALISPNTIHGIAHIHRNEENGTMTVTSFCGQEVTFDIKEVESGKKRGRWNVFRKGEKVSSTIPQRPCSRCENNPNFSGWGKTI